ncbi:streptococcal hemagglutinin-like [Ambystoma mexicanum]|uniref:streptococcal hemagglutinin-like n=1 Tax=Ambystoma mexicanum TaxID=8296 RepID=UPI0037E8955A
MEGIEGVGGMERGVPTSGDEGSESHPEDEHTPATKRAKKAKTTIHAPSTSAAVSQTPQQAQSTASKQDGPPASTPVGSRPAAAAPPVPTLPATEGTGSAASSSIGESAAIAACSDFDIEEHDVRHPTDLPHSPCSSHASPHEDPTQGHTEEEEWPSTPCPVLSPQEGSSPSITPPAMGMAQQGQQSLEDIIQRQEQLSTLLTEHAAECVGARAAIEQATETIRAEIAQNTDTLRDAMQTMSRDICGELAGVRRVLSELSHTLQDMHAREQTGTSSAASSAQSTPVRRSGRNLRSTGRGAPGAGRGGL